MENGDSVESVGKDHRNGSRHHNETRSEASGAAHGSVSNTLQLRSASSGAALDSFVSGCDPRFGSSYGAALLSGQTSLNQAHRARMLMQHMNPSLGAPYNAAQRLPGLSLPTSSSPFLPDGAGLNYPQFLPYGSHPPQDSYQTSLIEQQGIIGNYSNMYQDNLPQPPNAKRHLNDMSSGKTISSIAATPAGISLDPRNFPSLKKRKKAGRPAEDETWKLMFDKLVNYKEEHGDCLVPVRFKGDRKLGAWVRNQRIRKETFSEYRRNCLDSVGFDWSVKGKQHRELWDSMFAKLVRYRAEHGDCMVPQRCTDDPQLGTWVHNQRLRKDTLPKDRVNLLDSFGFIWCVTPEQTQACQAMKYTI